MTYEVEVVTEKSPLTKKENGVMRLIALGFSRRGIQDILKRSEGTVNTHVNHILQKLNVDNVQQAIAIGFIKGILVSKDKLPMVLFILFTSFGYFLPSTVYATPISQWGESKQQPVNRSKQRGRGRLQVRSSASIRGGHGRSLD